MPVLFLLLLSFLQGLAADTSGYQKLVQPYVAKHCSTCHNAKAKVAGLDLDRTADSITADQDVWEKVARKIKTGEMPPKGLPVPPSADSAAVTAWIDKEFARYDKARGQHDPGRVTARRLNRVEYNNTIRDLTGLDLHPADAFPVDDSGYGFDNIGDVLSLSPALMEKYMTAAERVARASIAIPRTFRETSDRYRSDRVKQVGPPGSIDVSHNFPIEGDYTIRIAIAGKRIEEADGLFVSALVDGREMQRFDGVNPPNKPRMRDLTIRPPAGTHRIRVQFTNADGRPVSEDKGVLIEYLDIRGPKNPGAFAPPPSHKLILVCGEWPGKYSDACLRQIVETFARRAFRRPVTTAEVDTLFGYVTKAKADGEPPERALRLAMQAVLVSPHFLFRVERDAKPTDTKAVHRINEFELASRLSYFLWSSMPDEELYNLAAKGRLRRNLEPQVRRMVADRKFAAFTENFVGQWLGLRNLDEAKPAKEKFPQFDNELREAMKMETQLFFENVVREDRSLAEFLDANYTFLNERLAKHYGIAGVSGPEFRKVTLTTSQRGGLVTMASVLTVSSYPNRTSPVIRGKYLLENFLNSPPPAPPPNVPSLEESAGGMKGTLRQQLEKHRTNAICASCHTRMDPLGFGLENYDAVGTWRETDDGFPIDASGTMPGGRAFQGPGELKSLLKNSQSDFAQCMAEKMMIYALGRGLEKQDRTFVRQVVSRVAADNYRFMRLVMEIVNSAPFQLRRGEAGGTS
ncbi:MAG: DUF1592 domain-containing protein [Bryobacterales bacterium]|nr:DUF1592 domain-containing protein [Bryobacterales bacterium]